MFLFDNNVTTVSSKPNKNKLVYLLFTTHKDNELHETGKPDIIMMYNATKVSIVSKY